MAFHRYCPHLQKSLRHAGGVTVEWLRDQSRPFSFTVSKSRGAWWNPVAAHGYGGYGRWVSMGFTQNNVVIFPCG
jgi:hypothetical protein